ncbi:MAG: hypothetical protein R3E32_02350 [Chitinophagales bacterium]
MCKPKSKLWPGWGPIIGALITASVAIAIFILQKENTFPYTIQIHNQINQETLQNVTVVIEVEGKTYTQTTDSDGEVTTCFGATRQGCLQRHPISRS